MSEKYELLFSGKTTPGADLEKVRATAARLFHASPAQLEALFSGSPVVLKNNLEKVTAETYQTKLQSAGLICSLQVMSSKTGQQQPTPMAKPAPQPKPAEQTALAPDNPQKTALGIEGKLTLAPTGDDINPHEEASVPPMPETSQFSLKEQKGDLFDKDDSPPPPAPDTDHISLE